MRSQQWLGPLARQPATRTRGLRLPTATATAKGVTAGTWAPAGDGWGPDAHKRTDAWTHTHVPLAILAARNALTADSSPLNSLAPCPHLQSLSGLALSKSARVTSSLAREEYGAQE